MKTKTRKTTRILCASSIAAMTLLGSVAPALTTVAAVGDTSSTTPANQISFEKKILLDANENVPNATIDYTLEGRDATADEVKALNSQKFYNVKKGTVSLSAGSTEFKADDNVSTVDGTRSITKTSKINASDLLDGVTQPTVFTYTLSEKVQGDVASKFVLPNEDGGDKRNLYIFVGYANEKDETNKKLSVLGSFITRKGATPEGVAPTNANKVSGFENKYVTSDNEDTKAFKVTKKVTGNQGDKTASFGFTVTIHNQYSKVTVINPDGTKAESSAPTASNVVTVKTKLEDGQSLTVKGLTQGAKYEVDEDKEDKDQNGYKTTKADPTTGEIAETVVTNERKGTIPTGIYLNHKLPFNILGVALAGGAVALIAKKRHEDALEDEDDE